MAIKTFTAGEVLTASDTNTYLNNGGLVYITQATISTGTTSINNCFSSTYRNYRIVMNITGVSAASAGLYFRFRASGTDNSTTNYKMALANISTTGTVGSTVDNGGNAGTLSFVASASVDNYLTMDINGPNTATRTLGSVQTMGYDSIAWVQRTGGFEFDAGTVFDGITFFNNTGTMNGVIHVYGYRNL
jgi:hypothetical protein